MSVDFLRVAKKPPGFIKDTTRHISVYEKKIEPGQKYILKFAGDAYIEKRQKCEEITSRGRVLECRDVEVAL